MSAAPLLDVVVHALTPAGDRVLLIDLRPADPGTTLPPFTAGAHIDLHLGSFVRQYSLVGGDDDHERYLIAVLRERVGRGGSAAVHDTLRVGDVLRVSSPRNSFPLDLTARHSILVAGGIGITPLVAMAERLDREAASFELHVYTANPRSLPLRDHLAARPWKHRVVTHFSEHGDTFRGNAPAVIPASAPGVALYLCGPAGLVASASACASARKWPSRAVHVEHFARTEPVETGGEAFTVVAASTGQRLPVGADETIAAVLQRNGFQVFLSCEQGICGSCLTGVLDGHPEHRDEVQSAAEHEANSQINVCCSRARTPVLTLDI